MNDDVSHLGRLDEGRAGIEYQGDPLGHEGEESGHITEVIAGASGNRASGQIGHSIGDWN
jgi:hypothetical protein